MFYTPDYFNPYTDKEQRAIIQNMSVREFEQVYLDADLAGATYSIEGEGKNREYIIRFNRKPCDEIRSMMKSVRIWWDPLQMYWHGPVNRFTEKLISDLFDY